RRLLNYEIGRLGAGIRHRSEESTRTNLSVILWLQYADVGDSLVLLVRFGWNMI
ncbi:hypothetical protein LTR49_028790, partial [Elasticomyces elasticus]